MEGVQRTLFASAAQDIAREMAGRRLSAQGRMHSSARPMLFRRLRKYSHPIYGRTSSGHPILTFPLDVLNVDARDPANVRMFFRREERLPADFRAGQPVPRRHVMHVSDIFHAVRQLAHVAETHRQERGKTNSALELVEQINAKLMVFAQNARGTEAAKAANREMEAMPEMRALASAYKHMALEQLQKALRLLGEAENSPRANLKLGAACACLVSFRARMGEWRVRQTFNIDAYDELREASLRLRRDKYVQGLLEYYVEMLSGPRAFQAAKAAVENHILSGKLRDFHGSIPKGREWRNEARRLLCAIGLSLPQESATRKLLRGAYRLAGEGTKEEFEERMGAITRPLLVRDLPYAADELERSSEPYRIPVIEKIRSGFAAVEKNTPADAVPLFQEAAEILRRPDQ
ncbi:MAG: hypothetical protein AB1657_02550 [Candidatus Micrarchaeota archaeon]